MSGLLIALLTSKLAIAEVTTGNIRTQVAERLKAPAASGGELITESDAVALVLSSSPSFEAALSTLGLLRADVIEAGLLRNPTLSLLFPVGAKPFELLLQAPIEALIQRPRRVRASKTALEQAGALLVQTGLDAARDAKLAHADLWLNGQRHQLLTRLTGVTKDIAALTARKLEAGGGTRIEVILAEADRATVMEMEARTAAALDQARNRLSRLQNRVPVPGTPNAAAADRAVTVPEVNDLVETSLVQRPDLRSAELAVRFATERAGWERSRWLALAPMLSSKGIGDRGILSGPGLLFDIPIFNRNQGQIARADADVERASKAYAALRYQIALEVTEAFGQHQQAQAALNRLRQEVLPLARESTRLVEQAFREGDVARLDVMITQRREFDIELRILDAMAELRRARAQLERAAGSNL